MYFGIWILILLSPVVHAAPAGTDVRIVWSGPESGNEVALTFDDGPNPGVTERVLNLLRSADAKGTFFLVGNRVRAAGAEGRVLLNRMVAEGHELGNHTNSHPAITKLSHEALIAEVNACQRVVEEASGVRPRLFRPPGGALSVNRIRTLSGTDIEVIVNWSVDPSDWKIPSKRELWNRVAREAKAGSIILFHDTNENTLEALPLLIDLLQARGFRLVTVSELLD